MERIRQTDCFKMNFKFWKILGIWPGRDLRYAHNLLSKTFITIFVLVYDLIVTINFAFIPTQMDILIEEMLFYMTELCVGCKIISYFYMKDKIFQVLEFLDSNMFQPKTENALKTIQKAMKFNRTYWRIVASVSIISNFVNVLSPLLFHIIMHVELIPPLSTYSFFSEEFKKKNIYPIFFYQTFGMHIHMLCNVNIDTFILGLLILIIAQLDILYYELVNVTNEKEKLADVTDNPNEQPAKKTRNDNDFVKKLNKCIIHFDEINKFCDLVQDIFSFVLFIQFSLASSVICVCLFRFTLPAPLQYYIFLLTYMTIMILQILFPCWFGTRVIEKSSLVALAAYKCDWTPRSRRFKSNLRIFVERANRPLSIVGGKMFPLSLYTFSSIMNTAYSFFTLLRHMQSRQNELM